MRLYCFHADSLVLFQWYAAHDLPVFYVQDLLGNMINSEMLIPVSIRKVWIDPVV